MGAGNEGEEEEGRVRGRKKGGEEEIKHRTNG